MRRLVRDAVSPAGEREKKEDAGKTCASQRVTPVPPFILQKKRNSGTLSSFVVSLLVNCTRVDTTDLHVSLDGEKLVMHTVGAIITCHISIPKFL